MLLQFLLPQSRAEAGSRRYKGTPSLLGDDYTLAFEFQIGALDGNDTDLQIGGKLADGGDRLAFRPVSDDDPALDLLHYLQIHRPLVGLGDAENCAHLYILSIYSKPSKS